MGLGGAGDDFGALVQRNRSESVTAFRLSSFEWARPCESERAPFVFGEGGCAGGV